MDRIKWLGIAVGVLVAAVGLSAYGTLRWKRATGKLLDHLESARLPQVRARNDARELEDLPPPVKRYFSTVLKDGQPIVAAASFNHAGSFNMGEASAQWKPFTPRQRVVTRRPGFVWDGRVRMLPGLPVNVHDAYVASTGILHPALLGLFTLIDLRGAGDEAQGEWKRFFAEAAWHATALLPSRGVRWEALDERWARASLVDGALSLTLLFRFDDQGLIESARAEAHGRTVGQSIVMTPWEGRWSNYQERDGMHVPMTGEVAWLAPVGRKPYWRGAITFLQYEYAP